MTRLRIAAASVLAVSLIAAPLSEASAHRWHGTPFFLWPFAAAGAVAAAVATAPFAVVAGAPAPYYAPPAYGPPRGPNY